MSEAPLLLILLAIGLHTFITNRQLKAVRAEISRLRIQLYGVAPE